MKKQTVYLLIMAAFVAEVALIATHAAQLQTAPWFFWMLAGPAVYRLARTISFNAIGAPIRAAFTATETDGSGAGDTVNPRKMQSGESHPLGELLSCPICTGTHAAAGLLALYGLLPAAGLALVALLGVAGINEAIHWMTEGAEWQGHAAREKTGAYIRIRERDEIEEHNRAMTMHFLQNENDRAREALMPILESEDLAEVITERLAERSQA